MKPSAVAQDYLKLIWSVREWHKDEPVTTTLLAARLGVTASTASEAVKRLAARGLVRHAPYAAIELTPEGERLALAMVRRHRLLETFLVHTLGFPWDEAHDDAEVLEHAASDAFISALDGFLGRPTRDPHGDPIPAADGTVAHPTARPLSDAVQGARAVVERISDADPAMLRYFAGVGLVPDALVTVLERRDFAGVIVVRVEAEARDAGAARGAGEAGADGVGRRVELGDIAAAAVWVSDAA
ncbi:MAG: metal-dependent transcriptional regulator [Bifidobacteriaceae bacterium]|jgi:DtxR family Mn-dependent transcriptional regulator|nr:metal-dependent transcriptional regulator [Bifidobacteriaceae bacterium]